jgi:predicted DsbA family dithiol-disulfide isomerase
MTVDVEPGTIVLFSDIACPWATVAVERFHEARDRVGAPVRLVHRAFPLELVNGRATPKPTLDAEIPVTAKLVNGVFRSWSGQLHEWPVTTLLALEAVRAAGDRAEVLDRALRRAFFHDSRCISLRSVILDVADRVGADVEAALDDGRCRRAIIDDLAMARSSSVKGSPHAFLPDGTDVHNPGIVMHWAAGKPVLDTDDPKVWDDLLSRGWAPSLHRRGVRRPR